MEWAKRMSKPNPERTKICVDVPIFGNVTVDSEERDALCLNPKFIEYGKISMEDIEVDKEVCNTKVRWREKEKIYQRNERQSVRIVMKDGNVVQDVNEIEKPTFERQTKHKNSVEANKACIAEAHADD